MQSQPIPDGLCQCGCGRPTGGAPSTNASKGWRRGVPLRYVLGHSARHAPHDYLEEDTGYLTPCWVWQRFKDRGGYGRKWIGVGRPEALAHRVYYELYVGPIPEGLQIDHLCRVRACVNPEHMEPVTFAENQRRGLNGILAPGYCKRGHPFNAENTHVDSKGRVSAERAAGTGSGKPGSRGLVLERGSLRRRIVLKGTPMTRRTPTDRRRAGVSAGSASGRRKGG